MRISDWSSDVCSSDLTTCARTAASLRQQLAGDDDAHDLVGAFQDLVHPQVPKVALDGVVLDVAVTAVKLQRLIADLEAGVGGEALGQGDGLGLDGNSVV